MLERQAAGVLLDPGLGKTAITLAAFDILRRKKLARKMLVIAPLRPCYLVWPAEIEGWKDFSHLRYSILHGRNKEEALEADADVYIINPEGLDWLLGSKNGGLDMRRWRALGFDTLAIDELTRFKHSKGKRFKLMRKIIGTFQRRWGLTGTPAPNGLQDLFGQMFMLDEGNALGRYITHYRMQYFFNPDGNGWKWVPRAGAAELIYERLRNLCIRMRAEDYLELPTIVPLKIMLELPPAARDMYDKMEDVMIAKMEEKLIVASNAAAASTKLRQIANGAVYVDDDLASFVRGVGGKRQVLKVHDVKMEAVSELVEELQGNPLLLAYEFNHDLDRLLEHFGKDTPYIGSGVSAKRSREIESAWNAGEIPLLLGHPASMGHGLNFQGANKESAHVGFFSMFWDLELYWQFILRVRRQGSKAQRAFIHHFMMKDTVDEIIWFAQRRKEKGQNALSEALLDIKAQRAARRR